MYGKAAQTVAEHLLFLDFDGVLHPIDCAEDAYFCRIPLLEMLFKTANSNLGIVISSSWRHHHTYEELLSFLPEAISRRVVGTTGSAYIGKLARYQEIRVFLSEYRGCSDWLALDDAAWEFPESCSELVRCNGSVGLTTREIELVAKWAQGTVTARESIESSMGINAFNRLLGRSS